VSESMVTPILSFNMIVISDERNLAIIGLPEEAEFGGPWRISSGLVYPGRRRSCRNVAESLA
jgi:hypothetical protein